MLLQILKPSHETLDPNNLPAYGHPSIHHFSLFIRWQREKRENSPLKRSIPTPNIMSKFYFSSIVIQKSCSSLKGFPIFSYSLPQANTMHAPPSLQGRAPFSKLFPQLSDNNSSSKVLSPKKISNTINFPSKA